MRPAELRKLRERDNYCWHCGDDSTLVPHHRRNRGMGGSKVLDKLSNIIMVCAEYNGQMESNANIANLARDYGHKLGNWDGFDTPVFDKPMKKWFIITDDGRKVSSGPPMFLI